MAETNGRGARAADPRLVALATAVPSHVLPQADARRLIGALFGEALGPDRRLLDVFDHAEIAHRRVCEPADWYTVDHGFEEKNARYVEHAVRLGGEAARGALARAGLGPGDVDHVVFVSSTGLSTPSVDARLANALGFRADVRRTPVWGLGCAGGAAGLSRARDFARADPAATVLVVALELCSLTFQFEDRSKRNLVAASLFGDGAAAAVVIGPEATAGAKRNGHRPLALVDTRSTLWRDTEDVMGWTVNGEGLSVVFSRDIPKIVRDEVKPSLLPFLSEHGLAPGDGLHMVTHPGGVKVLRAWAEALDLEADAFRHARAVLAEHGNMSSPSCLFVLERFLEAGDIGAGDHALLAALGPGFAAEYVLLRGLDA
jgi:alkylresorcinol/alkylpyrone synthase